VACVDNLLSVSGAQMALCPSHPAGSAGTEDRRLGEQAGAGARAEGGRKPVGQPLLRDCAHELVALLRGQPVAARPAVGFELTGRPVMVDAESGIAVTADGENWVEADVESVRQVHTHPPAPVTYFVV
jgi:hypothetical protein